MSSIRQVIKNTTSGWLSIILRAVLSLITVPFLLKSLGADGYGLIAILGTIVGLSAVIDLGLRSALGQTLSELNAKNDIKAYSQTLSTALMLYISIAGIFSLVLYFSATSLVGLLGVPTYLHNTAKNLIQVYGIAAVSLSFITPIFSAALQSDHRFDIVNTVQSITAVLSNSAILLAVSLIEFTHINWVIITLSSQLISLLLLIIFFKKQFHGIKISIQYINFSKLKPLFNLGGYMYLIQLSGTISTQSNPLIISSFTGIKSVGLYQPALNISQAVSPIVMTLTSQLYPSVTRHHVQQNNLGIQKIFLNGTKYTLLLASLVAPGIFFFSDPFIYLWLSKSIDTDYLIVVQVVQVLVFIDILTYSSGTQWPVLLGMKKLRYLSKVLLSTALIDIITSIYLVVYTDFGMFGVLYGTIISKIIRVYLINRYVLNLLNVQFIEFFKTSIIRPVSCLIVTGIVSWIIVSNFNTYHWLNFIAMVCITSVVWLFIVWFIGLTNTEKLLIKQGKLRSMNI